MLKLRLNVIASWSQGFSTPLSSQAWIVLNDSECSAEIEANLSLKQRSIPVTITLLLRHHYTIMLLTITALHLKKQQQNNMAILLIKVFMWRLGWQAVISSAVKLRSTFWQLYCRDSIFMQFLLAFFLECNTRCQFRYYCNKYMLLIYV